MSTGILWRVLLSAFAAVMLTWRVWDRTNKELHPKDEAAPRYLPYAVDMLPLIVLALVVVSLAAGGWKLAAQELLSILLVIFLQVCVYDSVLLALLPFLRRHISARTCALLWLLPNYLYILNYNFYTRLPQPNWVVYTKGTLAYVLLAVWAAGFLLVMGWNTLSHLVFRAQLLKNAVPVHEPEVLAIWQQELTRAGIGTCKCRLVRSARTATPLTIGLFSRTTCVVLPMRGYTPEELTLALRHELIHIGREDARGKFFLVFCTAMCWFNPLLWIAMRKSADDFERSCDETVLLGEDRSVRRQYASLLLQTAGDERGFTTCLSASAAALRYRLKSIMEPANRRSGAILAGVLFFVLLLSCGRIALAYDGQTGAVRIFQGQAFSAFSVRTARQWDTAGNTDLRCTDEASLCSYLSGLELCELTGDYDFSEDSRELTLIFDTPQGVLGVTLYDRAVRLSPLYSEKPRAQTWYLPEGISWTQIDSWLQPETA